MASSHSITVQPGWMALATSTPVVRRSAIVAAIVGTILVAINHGDAVLRGDLGAGRLLRIALTVVVPYCVSTYSSVSALRASAREQHRDNSRRELHG
jgi:hypothetical protein